ncbi:hypothetical protein TNCV_1244041 [Trichonephila clavipes]|nr:hypothetical protein TNCV_1244041 [Trichonephila clavipes]
MQFSREEHLNAHNSDFETRFENALIVVMPHLHAEIVEVEIEVVSPSIEPSGNFAELNRTVTCMVLKANDRRTSCPCHDEFRGPRSDYVRQVALENNRVKPDKVDAPDSSLPTKAFVCSIILCNSYFM